MGSVVFDDIGIVLFLFTMVCISCCGWKLSCRNYDL